MNKTCHSKNYQEIILYFDLQISSHLIIPILIINIFIKYQILTLKTALLIVHNINKQTFNIIT